MAIQLFSFHAYSAQKYNVKFKIKKNAKLPHTVSDTLICGSAYIFINGLFSNRKECGMHKVSTYPGSEY